MISEESIERPYWERQNWTQCWIVDQLDGLEEFLKRNGKFTVNIALVGNGYIFWESFKLTPYRNLTLPIFPRVKLIGLQKIFNTDNLKT